MTEAAVPTAMPAAMPADWLVADWSAPTTVCTLMTSRNGGVSQGGYGGGEAGAEDGMNLGDHVGDDPAAVARNRALLQDHVPAAPRWLRQVHGTRVVEVDALAADHVPEADAAVTRRPGTVLAILVADCLPVLFADRAGTVVGAAHAGWRGLAGGVLENTLAAMHVPPADVLAWIGPGIGPDHFEVGQDVFDAFIGADAGAAAHFRPGRTGKWMADLPALARRRLQAAGVGEVRGGAWCTVADATRFWSYRRDGVCGRMAGLVWLAA